MPFTKPFNLIRQQVGKNTFTYLIYVHWSFYNIIIIIIILSFVVIKIIFLYSKRKHEIIIPVRVMTILRNFYFKESTQLSSSNTRFPSRLCRETFVWCSKTPKSFKKFYLYTQCLTVEKKSFKYTQINEKSLNSIRKAV